ncbi:uncharacterized protein BX664DRAFT_326751 [Halteromyces radiatus]|uniref:uncharacterized protein n=1 Tax=Halteromyces radiatus TaxID=101107 RepID=UPI00221E4B4B|nr:uncharacterized protein BX664DRAFT_326751 [Halteromyces radiatus]KAI8097589.1 hypothetical protein BX664DRAFT_326751 [Halteromyces radiatus]
MVSILWGVSALEERIEKATSEFIPSGQENLGLQLDISDQIRSKKVNAKEAMQAMKKRLAHKNPNVQLATLSLIDTCVKNSGDSFVKEIASKEFMDELTTMVRTSNLNIDVRNKILDSVQTWGCAAKGNPALGYMTDTYSILKAEGHVFPPIKQNIDRIMLESSAAPEWGDSSVCERCRTPFTMTNRKHHCRNCGGTFCQECSSRNMALPHLAINEQVRVCDGCHLKLKMYKITGQNTLPPLPPSTSNSNSSHPPAANAETDDYDGDIKKAIELSLKEDEKRKTGYGTGYSPSSMKNNISYSPQSAKVDDEDPDLAAAIAASLREMEIASPPQANYQYPSAPPSTDLSPTEMENIQLFSTLMEHVRAHGGNVINDPQINKLYTQIGALQPKLIRSLDDTIRKHRACVELHDKINKVVQIYDRLLEQRMSGYRKDIGTITSTTSYPYYGSAEHTGLPNVAQYHGNTTTDQHGYHQHLPPVTATSAATSSVPSYGFNPQYSSPSQQVPQQQYQSIQSSTVPMMHHPQQQMYMQTPATQQQQQPTPMTTQSPPVDERPLIDL